MEPAMRRTDFWKIVLASSLVSAGLTAFLLRWPTSSTSRAEFTPPVTASPKTALTADERINIEVYERLSQGVVNVTSTTLELNFWFNVIPQQGVGSGVVVDNEGRIVTNFHVIKNADRLQVTLFDNSTYEAKILGQDPFNDLAVLQIDCPAGKLYPIELGSSDDLKVGQKVLAIGNPFGLERTLTTGIISSLARSLKTDYGVVENVIQSDAAINPGNSGGPLLNTSGELIGINTAIYSRTGESAGIGFAVPVNILNRVVPDLVAHGRVLRPWFGVHGRALSPRLAQVLKLSVDTGFLVEQVERGSTAARAGIRGGDHRVLSRNFFVSIGGDVLVELDGEAVGSKEDIVRILESKRPGGSISAIWYRGATEIKKEIRLVGHKLIWNNAFLESLPDSRFHFFRHRSLPFPSAPG